MSSRLLRLARVGGAWCVLATWSLAACTDVGTNAEATVAIEFDSLPYPSLVAGDSLRDSLGVEQWLTAIALNYKGEQIPDVPFAFFSRDTTITIRPGGFVTAKASSTAGAAHVFAVIGGLQSDSLRIPIVLRPDSVAFQSTDTLGYLKPDPERLNVSKRTIAVKVVHVNADRTTAPVPAWLVSFRASEFHGRALPVGDTSVALPVNHRRELTWVDTTDAQGIGAREFFVKADSITAQVDSVIILATVLHRGVALAGSPVRLVLRLTPATLP